MLRTLHGPVRFLLAALIAVQGAVPLALCICSVSGIELETMCGPNCCESEADAVAAVRLEADSRDESCGCIDIPLPNLTEQFTFSQSAVKLHPALEALELAEIAIGPAPGTSEAWQPPHECMRASLHLSRTIVLRI